MKKLIYILLFVPFCFFGQTFEVGDSVILRNWESSVGVIQEIRDHKSNKNFKVKIYSDSGIFTRWASYTSIIPFQSEKNEVVFNTTESLNVENSLFLDLIDTTESLSVEHYLFLDLIGTLSECDTKSYTSKFKSLLDKYNLTCNNNVEFKNIIIENGVFLIEGLLNNELVLFEYDDVVDFFKFDDLYHVSDTGFYSWLQKNHHDIVFNGKLNTKVAAKLTNLSIEKLYSWSEEFNIQNLDGINYFTGLDSLTIRNISLLKLPELPKELKYLDCGINNLSTLPDLPKGLVYFDCSFNNLSSLPTLPTGITDFDCSSNNISNLPLLPNGLKKLNIGSNSISNLPDLHNELIHFDCSSNNISHLPKLPVNIEFFDCSYNNIDNLPNLPKGITELHVESNNITHLPELPVNLKVFDCASNNIKQFPKLPFSIESFDEQGFISNDLSEVSVPIYKLFKTENIYALIKLNTRNGKISQVHFSLSSDDFEGELTINKYSLVAPNQEVTGRFNLYPTNNSYNFILLDQVDGRTWQVQWNNERSKRFISRIK